MKQKISTYFVYVIILLLILWLLILPSNNRNWAKDVEILPYAEINNNQITIYNIRNFTYQDVEQYTQNYYDKTFNLDKLETVDFLYEPYSDWKGAAHTFLSFGFSDNNYIAVSVEIRNEIGEEYSALKGAFKKYEITYVLGDENDLIKLRTNHRKNPVYLYPVFTTPEKKKELFIDIINGVNKLKDNPEFYNTLTNTCTSRIVKHVNSISPKKVSLNYKYLFPGYSDELAFELGLIMKGESFPNDKEKYLIIDKAQKYENHPDFSLKIRSLS